MKTTINVKLLALLMILFTSVNYISAQCQNDTASYTYTAGSNGVVTFTNTSTGNISSGGFWDFGDNTYYNGPSGQGTVTHQYNASGWYYVCLTADSIDTCSSVFCDSVYVPNSFPCSANAGFSVTDNGNGNYSFTNTSTGNNLSYWWDFGDGNFSSTTHPNHTYSSNGVYVVDLFVQDANDSSCFDNTSFSINVTSSNPCANAVASFSFTDNGNGNFSFSNNSTGYVAPISYYWNFGDGNSSNVENPNHTYSTSGTYNVSFGIYDGTCSDSIWQQITVSVSCNINASFTTTDNGNGNYSFTNLSTGNNLSYWWDFDDGNYSSATNPNHTYNANGVYIVTLYIQDLSDSTCYDNFIYTINVTSATPCQNDTASYTYSVGSNGNVTFTNTSTGNISSGAHWDFGDGNYSHAISGSNNITHQYNTSGWYYVCLLADSIDACSSQFCDSVYVPTGANPCNANAGFTYTDNGGGNFSFNNTSTGNINFYYWNFGDGNTSTQINPSHTYNTNGSYPVQLIVFDTNNMCSDMYIHTITVTGVSNPLSCNASFLMFPDSNNSNVIVLNTSTGNNLTYFWDFGDGNTSTLAYPSYTYSTAGPFALCLTVSDGNGCFSTYCDSINSNGVVLKQSGFTINIQDPTITSVEENSDLILGINAYPNPIKDILTIDLNLAQSTDVKTIITDMVGNQIEVLTNSSLTSGNNKLYWNTNNVANGIYLLQVINEGTHKVKKLVVNK